MALALADNPQEALLLALGDLDENDFKVLKYHLRGRTLLPRGELEGLSRVDLATRLVLMHGAREAVKVVCQVLEVMKLLELVHQLSHICLNDYRDTYREYVRCLEERQEEAVSRSYTPLLLVAVAGPGSPEPEPEPDPVTVEALFDPGEEEQPAAAAPGPAAAATVVLQGSAGAGKTTLARKLVLDWAAGALFPGRFDYVFYVGCREVGLLPGGGGGTATLDRLLLWCCGDGGAPAAEIRRQPERLLFVLDGYDELQRPVAVGLRRPGPGPAHELLRRLLRGELLPGCSLLVTTRPLALRGLQALLRRRRRPPRHVRVRGFSEAGRERYVRAYFADQERAQKALDFVRGNDVLYQACQVPGLCWVVCSWLKGRMERGGDPVLETPSSGTDIFMAYVSTFLPPCDGEGEGDGTASSELTRDGVLRGLCSLAAEGIRHQRFLFEEADLRRHRLDGPRLAAFLSSHDYQEGLDIKRFYSFRHISFQEFFHAMSYLVKGDPSQLGEESLREVNRLLGSPEEQGAEGEPMTLSMQFLLDMSRKESSSNLELTFCFRISPSIKQDLKNFKEQMASLRHRRAWEWDFLLNEAKVKGLANCVQMSHVALKVEHSNEKRAESRSSFSVKTSLSNGKKEEQKCPDVGQGNAAGTPQQAAHGKGRGKRN